MHYSWKRIDYTYTAYSNIIPSQCSDGIDNDSDGKIDYPSDPGCENAIDNDETDPVIVGGDTPEMADPVPDSTLSESTETFQWTAGDQEDLYRLHVGTTGSGSYDIIKRNNLAVTSYSVTGLPTDGSTVYVRLWYRIGSSWKRIDYTNTAYTK
jgi:hypothetical protein